MIHVNKNTIHKAYIYDGLASAMVEMDFSAKKDTDSLVILCVGTNRKVVRYHFRLRETLLIQPNCRAHTYSDYNVQKCITFSFCIRFHSNFYQSQFFCFHLE